MSDGSLAGWPPFSLLLLTMLSVYSMAMLIVSVWLYRARRKLVRFTGQGPLVTILKPLRGVDELLEANLESFTTLEYPHWEMLCCARDPNDPALAVVRRVAARHPRCRIRIIAGAEGDACNPKVLLLEHMVPQAQGDVYWISDSNVRVEPGDLQSLLAPFTDRHVGLVFQPVVGVGEETPAAALENYRLTENAGAGMVFIRLAVGVNAVMGKGILIRRQALRGMGGFDRLRDVLAEDYLMGVEVQRAGWKVALSPVAAQAVHSRWSFQGHFGRQSRHSAMRARLSPWTYPLELLMNPISIALLPLATQGLVGLQMFLATVAVKTAVEACAIRAVRGSWPRARFVPMLPFKDLVTLAVWLYGIVNNRVNWRGTLYRMEMGTRLIRIDTAPAELRPSTTFRPAATETPDRRKAA